MYSWHVLESLLRYVQGKVMDGFTPVCTITADLSALSGHLKKLNGPRGDYWHLHYEVGILFGRTELEAMLIWKDSYVCLVQNVVPSCSSSQLLPREKNFEARRRLSPSSSLEFSRLEYYAPAQVTSSHISQFYAFEFVVKHHA
jgi:hypothetical protein